MSWLKCSKHKSLNYPTYDELDSDVRPMDRSTCTRRILCLVTLWFISNLGVHWVWRTEFLEIYNKISLSVTWKNCFYTKIKFWGSILIMNIAINLFHWEQKMGAVYGRILYYYYFRYISFTRGHIDESTRISIKTRG